MSEEHGPTDVAVERREEARRRGLFRIIAWIAVSAGAFFFVVFVVLGALVPRFPGRLLIPGAALFALASLASLWLERRGRLRLAILILMLDVAVTVLVATYFANGVRGPFAVVLVSLPLLAALLAGAEAGRYIALTIALAYLAITVLEGMGVSAPWGMSESTLRIVSGITFLGMLAAVTFVVRRFLNVGEQALRTAHQRSQELAAASRRAEQATQAEREAREREARVAGQLRQAVQEYTAFLARVMSGDYGARLELDQSVGGSEELRALGGYLNTTVDTLVEALREMQEVQRRYLHEAWGGLVQRGEVQRGFRYQGTDIEPSGEAWLPPMAQAVRGKDVAVVERALALPITVGDQVIGVLGARREEGASWDDDEMAILTAVTDQLGQTIESLRLLEETRRGEARERTIAEATSRMREPLDLEDVLQVAAEEMRRALDLDALLVRLTEPEANDGSH